jgi:large subunit ribosomal protein L35
MQEFSKMPKMKTHSSTKKRFKVTATGKILRRSAMKSHNLEHKSQKLKRGFDKDILVEPGQAKVINRLLGRR